ncbi:MAG: biotin--[Clostridia bacterium]|nr:biotin--[acetyl-CoA-carboxylase] ligase [Clostridia bacterium]
MSLNYIFEYHDKIDSTNKYVKERAKKGALEGLTVIANEQSCGYGRMGRSFHSPNKSGLYMSILLRPKIEPKDTLLITTAAAVATSEAIEEISGKKAFIKWVNDIYVDQKKACGILCESALSTDNSSCEYCILGIGINLYEPKGSFPDDIKNIAGTIFENEVGTDIKDNLVKLITNKFGIYYNDLFDENIYKKYKNRCFIIGKTVYVIKNNNIFEHKVCDLDKEFRLITKNSSNEYFLLDSGEVSLKCNI